ncbi:MAG: DUF5320 domain-containing protein [Anaerolineales bacterium]|nr:DUF5320 domain-containing protein [Anaerolineales bacterium]
MPARDGTGPLGQGPRSGRGLGNCTPKQQSTSQISTPRTPTPLGRFGRLWSNTFGRAFRRGRRNRISWK